MTIAASQDQKVLFEAKPEEKPWEVICSSRCYKAETDKKKCKCRCYGRHHGEGTKRNREDNRLDEFC